MRIRHLLCLMLLTVPPLARADSARVVTLYDVRRAEEAPNIDGRLDDACWQGKPAITEMVLRDAATRKRARVQTRTVLTYDEKALYLAIRMDEPNPEGLKKNIAKYDGQLWWDDSVEVYIEPGSSHRRYFKFMSNPLGTRADWQARSTPMGFKLLEWGTGTDWEVEPFIGEDFWSLEFRFPWSDLETAPPEPGDLWTFEIVRFRYAAPGGGHEYSAWNRGARHSAPRNFGNVIFSGSTSEIERVFSEKLRPVFGGNMKVYGDRGVITFRTYPEIQDRKTSEARELLAEIDRRIGTLPGGPEAKTVEALKKQTGKLRAELTELTERQPGPASTEGLEKLIERCRKVVWQVKYHELNASIAAAENNRK